MAPSPTPCSSSKRPSTHAPRTPRRRRHYPRSSDFSLVPRPRAVDSLPWISTLNDGPFGRDDAWDIADLSQLEFDDKLMATGPIRRRKSSTRARLRAEPLPPLVEPRRAAATPPPRFPRTAEIAFWNLMPVVTPPLFPTTP